MSSSTFFAMKFIRFIPHCRCLLSVFLTTLQCANIFMHDSLGLSCITTIYTCFLKTSFAQSYPAQGHWWNSLPCHAQWLARCTGVHRCIDSAQSEAASYSLHQQEAVVDVISHEGNQKVKRLFFLWLVTAHKIIMACWNICICQILFCKFVIV